MSKILFHTDNKTKKEKVERLAKRLKMEFVLLKDSDYYKTISNLVGLTHTKEVKSGKSTYPEVLIFFDLSEEQLDLFLDVYKQEKIERVALKAMVTETNVNWTIAELVDELEVEHKAFAGN